MLKRLVVAASVLHVPPSAGQGTFIPGAREILALNLATAQHGQLPPGVRGAGGTIDIVTRDGVRMLRATSSSEFFITLPEVLPTEFTIEFDLIPKACGCGEADLTFDGTSGTWSGTSARVQWSPSTHGVSGGGPSPFTMTTPTLGETAPGQLTRIIASFEGNTLKLYTNGQRLYTLSNRVFARGRVLRVLLGGQNEEQSVYLARVRVAAGAGSVVTAATSTSASTGTATPAGSNVQPAGTGTIATAAPTLVTTIAPQSGSIVPISGPTTPKIVSIADLSNTAVQIMVENTPETIPDEPTWKWQHFIVERRALEDTDACPSDFLVPPDPSRCFRFKYPWSGRAEDYGLEPGVSYSYRVASVYSQHCYWDPCPEKLFSSLPFSWTRSTQLLGIVSARQGLLAPSVEPRNVEVVRFTDATALITFRASIGVGQPSPAVPNEVAWLWIVDQWVEGAPPTCPAVEISLKVTDQSNCTRLVLTDDSKVKAWVESGTTYGFQVTSIFGTGCKWMGCLTYRGYPAPPITYKAPVFFTPQRPAQGTVTPVLPSLFLQVAKQGSRYSEWGCDSSWGRCAKRDVTFAWAPAANAAGYVISVDELKWDVWGQELVEVGVRNVPAGPAPEARFELYAGSTVRACLAVVGDPNVPPNPRKGECIQVNVEP